jgi:hypothetical protein
LKEQKQNMVNIYILQPNKKKNRQLIPSTQIGGFNPLNAKLKPICHLLALLGAHHILHLSRIRVKNTNTLQQFTKAIIVNNTQEQDKSGIHKLTSNTCQLSYIGQRSLSLKQGNQDACYTS